MTTPNEKNTIATPRDVSDPVELRRVLDRIIEKVDTAFGTRDETKQFALKSDLDALTTRVEALE